MVHFASVPILKMHVENFALPKFRPPPNALPVNYFAGQFALEEV
jgi:hypothetical protein